MSTGFWEGKRVLVTGGLGFIGKALCLKLRSLGVTVFEMDLKNGHDIGTWGLVSNDLHYYSPDVVYHLAALTEVLDSHKRPHDYFRANVFGTANVLEACRQEKVKGVVVASSDKAYGHLSLATAHGKPIEPTQGYKESWQLNHNADWYSSTKKMADEMSQDYSRLWGLPVRIARCCNVYGPGQKNLTTLVTGTVERLLRGKPVSIRSAAKREWMFIDDAVEAYLLLGQDACNGAGARWPNIAFNVGSGEVHSVGGVMGSIAAAMGVSSFTQKVETPAVEIGDQMLDSTKFRKCFDWSPKVGFAEGIKRTVAWTVEWLNGGGK